MFQEVLPPFACPCLQGEGMLTAMPQVEAGPPPKGMTGGDLMPVQWQ